MNFHCNTLPTSSNQRGETSQLPCESAERRSDAHTAGSKHISVHLLIELVLIERQGQREIGAVGRPGRGRVTIAV